MLVFVDRRRRRVAVEVDGTLVVAA